jgi:hypothetical protein
MVVQPSATFTPMHGDDVFAKDGGQEVRGKRIETALTFPVIAHLVREGHGRESHPLKPVP